MRLPPLSIPARSLLIAAAMLALPLGVALADNPTTAPAGPSSDDDDGSRFVQVWVFLPEPFDGTPAAFREAARRAFGKQATIEPDDLRVRGDNRFYGVTVQAGERTFLIGMESKGVFDTSEFDAFAMARATPSNTSG